MHCTTKLFINPMKKFTILSLFAACVLFGFNANAQESGDMMVHGGVGIATGPYGGDEGVTGSERIVSRRTRHVAVKAKETRTRRGGLLNLRARLSRSSRLCNPLPNPLGRKETLPISWTERTSRCSLKILPAQAVLRPIHLPIAAIRASQTSSLHKPTLTQLEHLKQSQLWPVHQPTTLRLCKQKSISTFSD